MKIALKKLVKPYLYKFSSRLNKYSFDIYSQNGEDGIIAELFKRLNIGGGWIVEFGAWDGIKYSNTYNLMSQNSNFCGVYIEGDENRYVDLIKTATNLNSRLIPVNTYVEPIGQNSLDSILAKTDIPLDFELLSIDVDSIDYQIWQNFVKYRPKIVIIEINSTIPPTVEYIHGQGDKPGSSFLSMLKLGLSKGYTLVCHTGNLFFIRNDLANKVNINSKYLKEPSKLFIKSWLEK